MTFAPLCRTSACPLSVTGGEAALCHEAAALALDRRQRRERRPSEPYSLGAVVRKVLEAVLPAAAAPEPADVNTGDFILPSFSCLAHQTVRF